MKELGSGINYREVPCRYCGAFSNQHCTVTSDRRPAGTKNIGYHLARRQLYWFRKLNPDWRNMQEPRVIFDAVL